MPRCAPVPPLPTPARAADVRVVANRFAEFKAYAPEDQCTW